jgi:hypothetical protein
LKRDYQQHKELFSQLTILLTPLFSESELQEVTDFVDVNEFGVALETLVEICAEKKLHLSDRALELCSELKRLMKVTTEVDLSRLSSEGAI